MGRIRVYSMDSNPSVGLTYSELSQVEISSKEDHPNIVDDENFKVKDLKLWVEEKTGATPIQQVYYHCCDYNNLRSNSGSSKPYRYLFESSPSLNEKNNDAVPLGLILARYYEKVKLQRCKYIKRWIGVGILHHEDEANSNDTITGAVVDSAAERRTPKRRRHS